jgi:Ca2+-binding RTX toxin-like protein
LGQDGRDLLIGGLGGDRLEGGAGEDILIGGTTVWDDQQEMLNLVMAEWTRPDVGYDQRIGHLRYGSTGWLNIYPSWQIVYPGGLNVSRGVPVLLRGTEVHDDGASDELVGNEVWDRDWFFVKWGTTNGDLHSPLSPYEVLTWL